MSIYGLTQAEVETLLVLADSVAEESPEDAVLLLKQTCWSKHSSKAQKNAALKKILANAPNLDSHDSLDAYMFVGARASEGDELKMKALLQAVEVAVKIKDATLCAKTLDSVYRLAPVWSDGFSYDYSKRNALVARARELGVVAPVKKPDTKNNAPACG